jgi:hypothetical protein
MNFGHWIILTNCFFTGLYLSVYLRQFLNLRLHPSLVGLLFGLVGILFLWRIMYRLCGIYPPLPACPKCRHKLHHNPFTKFYDQGEIFECTNCRCKLSFDETTSSLFVYKEERNQKEVLRLIFPKFLGIWIKNNSQK